MLASDYMESDEAWPMVDHHIQNYSQFNTHGELCAPFSYCPGATAEVAGLSFTLCGGDG